MMKNNHATRLKVLPWLIFGAALVFFVVIVIHGSNTMLDCDMSSELILAKLLADGQGFIVTNQWFYSTELRFLNTQLVFTPLFWLFHNWRVVRILGTIILNLILLGAFDYFLTTLNLQKFFPYLAVFLLLPISKQYFCYVSFGTYYIPHIVISLIVLGLVFQALKTPQTTPRVIYIVCSALLSLLAALGGFRQIVILNLPLLLTAVWFWYQRKQSKFLLISGINFLAAILGLGINLLILHQFFDFDAHGSVCWQKPSWNLLVDVLVDFLVSFGFNDQINLFKNFAGSLTNVMAIGLLIFFMISLISILKNQQQYQDCEKILAYFTLSAMVVLVVIVVCFDLGTTFYVARYNLPILFFALPIGLIYLKGKPKLRPRYSYCGVILLFIAGLISVNVYWPQDNLQGYRRAVAALQQDGNFTAGYATAAHANLLTELSNGALDVWIYTDTATGWQIDEWLQKKSHAEHQPEGKVFLFVNENEVVTLNNAAVFYHADGYIIYVFDSVLDKPINNA